MNKELQIVLETGLNELYLTQQKECILTSISTLPNIKKVGTEEFLLEVNETLKKLM